MQSFLKIIKYWLLIWVCCGGLTGGYLALTGDTGRISPPILLVIIVVYSAIGAVLGGSLYAVTIELLRKIRLPDFTLVVLAGVSGTAGAYLANLLNLGVIPHQASVWGACVGFLCGTFLLFKNDRK